MIKIRKLRVPAKINASIFRSKAFIFAGALSPSGLLAKLSARWQWPALSRHLMCEYDRWFLWYVVFFGCGIAIYCMLPGEPHILTAFFLVIMAGGLACVWQQGVAGQFLPKLLLALALGIGCAKVETMAVEAPVLPGKLFQVQVQGQIEKLEPRPSRGPRLTLRVAQIAGVPPEKTPHRVRIRLLQEDETLRVGQAIEIRATLMPPMRPALPGGYDFARSAFFQRIGAVGYASAQPRPIILPPPSIGMQIKITIQQLRHNLGERILAAAAGERGAIANALMTGERGLISDETLSAYRDAGLLHILSISGLHMAIMAGTVFFVVRFTLAAWSSIALRYPIKKWAALASLIAAAAYLLISGTTHATQRAFVMVCIMMCAIILDRPAIALRNVAIAAAVLLAIAPSSLLNVGFQMSFAAVIALVAAYEYIRDRRADAPPDVPRGMVVGTLLFFAGIIGSTVVASLAVAPIGAYHFHKGQLYSVLANLIAVPVCNFLVMPAALLTFLAMPFGLEALPLWIMVQGIDVMTWCARTVADLPGAVVHITAFSALSFALMIFGMLWLCLWRENWRFCGIFFIACGLFTAPLRSRPDILIAEGGRLVAIRGPDDRLAAVPEHRRMFEWKRWLEYDGGAIPAATAAPQADRFFQCDPAGCIAKRKGLYIAVSKSPASLGDDCRRAHFLILSYPKPAACQPASGVIDFWQLRDGGTHAVTIGTAGALHITRVEDYRGNRPWTQNSQRLARRKKRKARQSVEPKK